MLRRLRVVGALFLCALFLMAAHCPRSPLSIYTGTRTAFNNYLETYLNYRDAFPDGSEKDALRAKYEQRFEDAEAMLDEWGKAVGTDVEIIKQRAFNALFDEILRLLIKEGIVKPVTTRGGQSLWRMAKTTPL